MKSGVYYRNRHYTLNHVFSAVLGICLLSLILLIRNGTKFFKIISGYYNGNLQKWVINYLGTIVQKCI